MARCVTYPTDTFPSYRGFQKNFRKAHTFLPGGSPKKKLKKRRRGSEPPQRCAKKNKKGQRDGSRVRSESTEMSEGDGAEDNVLTGTKRWEGLRPLLI